MPYLRVAWSIPRPRHPQPGRSAHRRPPNTPSCAPSTLPVHQQALLAEDLPRGPCLRARQFKDHGPGDPLDPATTLPKSDERCRCTQVIRPGVGYEVSQVLFRLMKPVFETTYGAQRTPMPKLPQHRLPHQTHDSGIHTLNPHACNPKTIPPYSAPATGAKNRTNNYLLWT